MAKLKSIKFSIPSGKVLLFNLKGKSTTKLVSDDRAYIAKLMPKCCSVYQGWDEAKIANLAFVHRTLEQRAQL